MAKRKATPDGVAFFLAEDEGFEPPQTESESGVLPLHKSSMSRGQHGYYTANFKNVKNFFKIFKIIFQGGAEPLPYCSLFCFSVIMQWA